jgi:hypothetical protein
MSAIEASAAWSFDLPGASGDVDHSGSPALRSIARWIAISSGITP